MKLLFLFLKTHKQFTLVLAVFWTLMILVACLLPGRDIPNVKIPLIDKWVHFIIFGGFSFLWACVLKDPLLRKAIFILLWAVLLGTLVELIQGSGLVSGRSFELLDILADGIGGLLGLLLFFYLQKRTGRPAA